MRQNYQKVTDDWQLAAVLHREDEVIQRCAFVSVNMTAEAELALAHHYRDCIFLGCVLPMGLKKQSQDCLFFPNMGELFHLCTHLYSPDELYEGYEPGVAESYSKCFDGRVYRHYLKMGKRADNIKETLARALHDHSISDCMHDFLSRRSPRQVVGVMGGHSLLRTDEAYRHIVLLSKSLTEEGFLMVSGGGPGAMEATHLGAWMAGRSAAEVDEAIGIMQVAPCYADEGWLDTAMCVRSKFPQQDYESLGSPTWLYGHEPSTPLATHIAKYFDNSIREDGILTIARGGVIFTPGSAGTLQEIFQAAVPNHYMSFGYASPMIFMGETFWTSEVPIWPLLQELVAKEKYKNLLLTLTDDEGEIVRRLLAFRTEESNA